MIDLETFGTSKNAAIVQVGACYFDRSTGEIGDTFKRNIDAASAMKSGAEMDAGAVYFWLNQPKEAQTSIISGVLQPIDQVFKELNDFLNPAKRIWSHATFDFVIIMETFRRLGIKPSFGYKAARDIRTLTDLANLTIKKVEREGIHHDALDDAKYQVKYCTEAFKKLNKKGA